MQNTTTGERWVPELLLERVACTLGGDTSQRRTEYLEEADGYIYQMMAEAPQIVHYGQQYGMVSFVCVCVCAWPSLFLQCKTIAAAQSKINKKNPFDWNWLNQKGHNGRFTAEMQIRFAFFSID